MQTITQAAFLLAASAICTNALASGLSHQEFEQQIKASVAPLAGKEIAGLKVLYLSADVGPWLDTGLALAPGDTVTMVLDGKMWLSRSHDLSFEAWMAAWARIGDGPIFRGTASTNTFVAEKAGTLQMKNYPGQRWLDPAGKYDGEPAPVNPDSGGGVSVALLRWNKDVDVQQQLQHIAATDGAGQWAKLELERQQAPERRLPADWYYLWETGPSRIFGEVAAPTGDGAPARAIDLHTKNDVGIIKTDVSIPLTPETTLSWKWKADKIPAAASENTLPTHDYMSIAVEFDNGQDITFIWSHDLPVGQSFRCPLPGWDFRETHIVARSGAADLGKWLGEQHNLFDNYQKAVGGPIPKRITKIWLIAVSLFQKTEGMSQFGEIILKDGTGETRVFADSGAAAALEMAASKP